MSKTEGQLFFFGLEEQLEMASKTKFFFLGLFGCVSVMLFGGLLLAGGVFDDEGDPDIFEQVEIERAAEIAEEIFRDDSWKNSPKEPEDDLFEFVEMLKKPEMKDMFLSYGRICALENTLDSFGKNAKNDFEHARIARAWAILAFIEKERSIPENSPASFRKGINSVMRISSPFERIKGFVSMGNEYLYLEFRDFFDKSRRFTPPANLVDLIEEVTLEIRRLMENEKNEAVRSEMAGLLVQWVLEMSSPDDEKRLDEMMELAAGMKPDNLESNPQPSRFYSREYPYPKMYAYHLIFGHLLKLEKWETAFEFISGYGSDDYFALFLEKSPVFSWLIRQDNGKYFEAAKTIRSAEDRIRVLMMFRKKHDIGEQIAELPDDFTCKNYELKISVPLDSAPSGFRIQKFPANKEILFRHLIEDSLKNARYWDAAELMKISEIHEGFPQGWLDEYRKYNEKRAALVTAKHEWYERYFRENIKSAERETFESQPFRSRFFEFSDTTSKPEEVGQMLLGNLEMVAFAHKTAKNDKAAAIFLRLFHKEFISRKSSVIANKEHFINLGGYELGIGACFPVDEVFSEDFLKELIGYPDGINENGYDELQAILDLCINSFRDFKTPLRILSELPKTDEESPSVLKYRTIEKIVNEFYRIDMSESLEKADPEIRKRLESLLEEKRKIVEKFTKETVLIMQKHRNEQKDEIPWDEIWSDPGHFFGEFDRQNERDNLTESDSDDDITNHLLDMAYEEFGNGDMAGARDYMERLSEIYRQNSAIERSGILSNRVFVYYSRLALEAIEYGQYEQGIRTLLEGSFNFPFDNEYCADFYGVLLVPSLQELNLRLGKDEDLRKKIRTHLAALAERVCKDGRRFPTHSGMQMLRTILDMQITLGFERDAAKILKEVFPQKLDMRFLSEAEGRLPGYLELIEKEGVNEGKTPAERYISEIFARKELVPKYPYLHFLTIWDNKLLAMYRMRCGMFDEVAAMFGEDEEITFSLSPFSQNQENPNFRTDLLTNLAEISICVGDFAAAEKWLEKIDQPEFAQKYISRFDEFMLRQKGESPEAEPLPPLELATRVWNAAYYMLVNTPDSPEKRDKVGKLLERSIELFASIDEPELRDKTLAYRFELLYADGFREMAFKMLGKIKSPHLAAWALIDLARLHERRENARCLTEYPFALQFLPDHTIFSDYFGTNSPHWPHPREVIYNPWFFLNLEKSERAVADFANYHSFMVDFVNSDKGKEFQIDRKAILELLEKSLEIAKLEQSPYEKAATLGAIGMMLQVYAPETVAEDQAKECYKLALEAMKTEAAKLEADKDPEKWVVLGTAIANLWYEIGEPDTALPALNVAIFGTGRESDEELISRFTGINPELNRADVEVMACTLKALDALGRCGDPKRAASLARKMLEHYQACPPDSLDRNMIFPAYISLREAARRVGVDSEKIEREYADYIEAGFSEMKNPIHAEGSSEIIQNNIKLGRSWVVYEKEYRLATEKPVSAVAEWDERLAREYLTPAIFGKSRFEIRLNGLNATPIRPDSNSPRCESKQFLMIYYRSYHPDPVW